MKVGLGHPPHYPFARHGPRLHRFHGSRFPLSFFATRCHIPCMRVYTDSDTGSDIQQESLLDNVHTGYWDNVDFSYPYHSNQDDMEHNVSPSRPNPSPRNHAPATVVNTRPGGDPYLSQLPNLTNSISNNPVSDMNQNDGRPPSLDLWGTQLPSISTNRSANQDTQDTSNQVSRSVNSLPGYAEYEDDDSMIDSLPEDALEAADLPNHTNSPRTEGLGGNPFTQPSLLDEILSSFDQRLQVNSNSRNVAWPWSQNSGQTVGDSTPADVPNGMSGALQATVQESATNRIEEQLDNVPDNPVNEPNDAATDDNQETSVGTGHSSNEEQSQSPSTLAPPIPPRSLSPILPLPMPVVSDEDPSPSNETGEASSHQDWYYYDPRLAPGGNAPRINFQSNFHDELQGLVSPPNYEEAIGSSPPARGVMEDVNNWVMLTEEENNIIDQQSDTGQSLPPPYQDLPPPSYEQSFHHQLLMSGHGYIDADSLHRDNPVSNLNGISHLLRHIPLTTEGNTQSNILVRDTNTIFLPDTQPVRIEDLLQDSDSLRDSDLLQDFFLLEDNHDCGESTTEDSPHELSLPNHNEHVAGSLPPGNISGNSPHDTIRSHASSVLQLSMSLRRYPVGTNLGQRPAVRWSRGIGIDRWASSTNWII